MFVETDVFCKAVPIASATDMKRLPNRLRRIGSGPVILRKGCVEEGT